MSDPKNDQEELDGFLEIRKPGAHLEKDVVADDFVLMLGVDVINYPKFHRVDDGITYPKAGLDIRQQLDVDSGAELPDYGGPYRARPALHRLLEGGARGEDPAVERAVSAAGRRSVVPF
jgi:hypothetical protein